MTLLERALKFVGLKRTARRAVGVPARRMFAASRIDRLSQDWLSALTSGEQEARLNLRVLRGRSQTLVRDTPDAKRYCALFEENVIGEQGIRLVPQVKTPAGEFDRAVNEKILTAWNRWGEPETCSLDGRSSWLEIQWLIARSEPMDGEYLLRLVTGAPNAFGFAVQLLDPDQLDTEFTVEHTAAGGRIVQGVEMDANGRPIAYHLWQGHPNDASKGQRVRIPAEEIVHHFAPFRVGAKRGIPWLHAGMTSVNMLGGYHEAELTATRLGAANPGFFEATQEGSLDDEEEPAELPQDAEPGTYYKLPFGYKFAAHETNHPTTAFGAFVKSIRRAIAAAGNVSYTSLSGDLEAVSFSSSRIGLEQERERFRMGQQRYIAHLCPRVYRAWLRAALLTGQLELPAAQIERYHAVQWKARGFPYVQPLDDVDTLEHQIKLGLKSRTAACNENGTDFEQTLAQLDHERQLAEEYGVSIEGSTTAIQHPSQVTTPPMTPTDATDSGTTASTAGGRARPARLRLADR